MHCRRTRLAYRAPAAIERAETTLRWFAEKMPQEHGWFYHFVNLQTGAREWQSELSSIDTALLLSGVLTVRSCFGDDPDVARYADAIYRRVDFQWMLAGEPTTLSHGWKPESGFLAGRWDRYCELMILYALAIGSPTHPIPSSSWFAWSRPVMTFEPFTYVSWSDPLFVHQVLARVDRLPRGVHERGPAAVDWFQNSVVATRAHKAFVLSLAGEFPGYSENVWGITASDSRKGYVAWGGPPRNPAIDGSVVPAAAAGSLMFTPEITLPALRAMRAASATASTVDTGSPTRFIPPTAGSIPTSLVSISASLSSAPRIYVAVASGSGSWRVRRSRPPSRPSATERDSEPQGTGLSGVSSSSQQETAMLTGSRLLATVVVLISTASLGAARPGQAPPASTPPDTIAALLVEVRGLRRRWNRWPPPAHACSWRSAGCSSRNSASIRSCAGSKKCEQHWRQRVRSFRRVASGWTLREGCSRDSPIEEQRRDAEAALPRMKREVALAAAEVQRLQNDEGMLLQDINSEQNRWTEFNQRLEELERSLPRR